MSSEFSPWKNFILGSYALIGFSSFWVQDSHFHFLNYLKHQLRHLGIVLSEGARQSARHVKLSAISAPFHIPSPVSTFAPHIICFPAAGFLVDQHKEALQGPALYAFNDSEFEEADFESISNIGDSVKRGKAGKTGRFGVGFNSCYHLTDLPSFVSGRHLVMFDPHATFLPNVSASNPGKKIDFVASKVPPHSLPHGTKTRRDAIIRALASLMSLKDGTCLLAYLTAYQMDAS